MDEKISTREGSYLCQHSYLWQNQEQNHKRIFWWVPIPSQIFSPVAGRKVVCTLFCFKGLILLNNISRFIYVPVQWGSSLVFLSVGDTCQLAAGHTSENPHYILIHFPPNQYAPSQSGIQSTHNPRLPCNRVEVCDLCCPWSVRCAIKKWDWKWAMGRDHCPPRSLCLTRRLSVHERQRQTFWHPVLSMLGAQAVVAAEAAPLVWLGIVLSGETLHSCCWSLLDLSTSYPCYPQEILFEFETLDSSWN